MINIQSLIDDAKCYETVRDLRWPDGVRCPHCGSGAVSKRGHDERQQHRQRYVCKGCGRQFDDLSETIFEGHHQPLRVWVLCLYFMGLNLSNQQIAAELDLNPDDVQDRTTQLREGIAVKKSPSNWVGKSNVYIIAGHKGHPEVVRKLGRSGRRRRLKGKRGRGTLAGEKPPVLGMIQRGGEVVLQMLANVQQKTIQPILKQTIHIDSLIFTDEYAIYARLESWGYRHQTVNHSIGE
jgi:transposase-like protein